MISSQFFIICLFQKAIDYIGLFIIMKVNENNSHLLSKDNSKNKINI